MCGSGMTKENPYHIALSVYNKMGLPMGFISALMLVRRGKGLPSIPWKMRHAVLTQLRLVVTHASVPLNARRYVAR